MTSSPDALQVVLIDFCFFCLEHGLRIHGFRSTWPCLIVEVPLTRATFLEESSNCTEYLSLLPTREDLIQGRFYSGDFRGVGGRARASNRAQLDYVGHRLTGCNVSLWSCWDQNSLSAIWIRLVCKLKAWTRLEDSVLCCAANNCSPTHGGLG